MLNLFRRHLRSCHHRTKGRKHHKCNCPLAIEGYLNDKLIRKSVKETRSWELGQAKVREMEVGAFFPTAEAEPEKTVKEAVARYIANAKALNYSEATIRKLTHLTEKRLLTFCAEKGIESLKQLDVDTLGAFREGWPDGPLSALKNLERLRSFFSFCRDRHWIADNPAAALKAPKDPHDPTLPFTPDDMEKILWACEIFSTNGRYRSHHRKRIKAMVLLMRWSGIAIGDAVTLERSQIDADGRLFLYRQKTKVPVEVLLPPVVTEALKELNDFQDRFFWGGNGKVETAVKVWAETLHRLFEIAGIEEGHSHRFRNTFAFELLRKGTPLHEVSILLGHKSIKTTEKYYNAWVKARQVRLDEVVRASW
jgi:integrase